MQKPTSCGRYMSPDDIVKARDYLDWLLDSGILTWWEYQAKMLEIGDPNDNKQTD